MPSLPRLDAPTLIAGGVAALLLVTAFVAPRLASGVAASCPPSAEGQRHTASQYTDGGRTLAYCWYAKAPTAATPSKRKRHE